MLKEDFKDGTTKNQNQSAGQPQLSELEKKYEKELNDYEHRTHFMQDHANEYEEESSAPVYTKGATMKSNSSEEPQYSRNEEFTSQEKESAASEDSSVTAGELFEKGAEAVKEKAGEVWQNVKSEWKRDRKEFVRKTLVGTAVTAGAIGLLLLSRKTKKKTGVVENVLNAI